MIKCAVFDFDGTLVLSNEIKRQAFFYVANEFHHGNALMERLLSEEVGDRFDIFAQFSTLLDKQCVSPEKLVEKYSNWSECEILRCVERKGAGAILASLQAASIPIYINSATPTTPLKSIVAKRYSESAFDGVFGSDNSKVNNLQNIAEITGLSKGGILMVGDGIDDYIAARDYGCHFVGVSDGTLERSQIVDKKLLLNHYSTLNSLLDNYL